MNNARNSRSRLMAIAATLVLHLAVLTWFYLGTGMVRIVGTDSAVMSRFSRNPTTVNRSRRAPLMPCPLD